MGIWIIEGNIHTAFCKPNAKVVAIASGRGFFQSPERLSPKLLSIKAAIAIRYQQALPRSGISPPEKLVGMPPSGVSYTQAYAKNKTEQFTDGDGLCPICFVYQHGSGFQVVSALAAL